MIDKNDQFRNRSVRLLVLFYLIIFASKSELTPSYIEMQLCLFPLHILKLTLLRNTIIYSILFIK